MHLVPAPPPKGAWWIPRVPSKSVIGPADLDTSEPANDAPWLVAGLIVEGLESASRRTTQTPEDVLQCRHGLLSRGKWVIGVDNVERCFICSREQNMCECSTWLRGK
jgi:hypothetical protein